jgi:hypothetical protein
MTCVSVLLVFDSGIIRMNRVVAVIVALLAIIAIGALPTSEAKSSSGACVGCTLIVAFVEQVQFATKLPLTGTLSSSPPLPHYLLSVANVDALCDNRCSKSLMC